MSARDIDPEGRFLYHKPSTFAVEAMNDLRAQFQKLAVSVVASAIPSRERSLALTKLEEAAMWANKAVTHHDRESEPEKL